MKQLGDIVNPIFLSYELLYLYKHYYLKSLDVGIPISWNDLRIGDILSVDSNDKYVHYVQEHFLDNCNRTGIPLRNKYE
jgi:hypothetical protein